MKKRIIFPQKCDDTIDLRLVNFQEGYIEVLDNDKNIGLILYDDLFKEYIFNNTGIVHNQFVNSNVLSELIDSIFSKYKSVKLNYIKIN